MRRQGRPSVGAHRRYDGGGWQTVRSKRDRRAGGRRTVDIASGPGKLDCGQCTSFYFSNFPETWWARDMLSVFSCHGRTQEVVIPARRNANGRRFGFVRFFNVQDPARLAIKLDNLFVEGLKIHVNIPRFQRVLKQGESRPLHVIPRPSNLKQVWKKKEDVIPPRSDKGCEKGRKGNCSFDIPIDPNLSRAMVGDVIFPGKSYAIQDEFLKQGVFAIKATPMGSKLVLLEGDKNDDDFKGFIGDAKNWLFWGSNGCVHGDHLMLILKG